MSYKQSGSRIDIRHLPLAKVAQATTTQAQAVASSAGLDSSYRPGKDIRMITLLVVPLVALLVAGFYYDRSHSWVVEFATYLFKLGK